MLKSSLYVAWEYPEGIKLRDSKVFIALSCFYWFSKWTEASGSQFKVHIFTSRQTRKILCHFHSKSFFHRHFQLEFPFDKLIMIENYVATLTHILLNGRQTHHDTTSIFAVSSVSRCGIFIGFLPFLSPFRRCILGVFLRHTSSDVSGMLRHTEASDERNEMTVESYVKGTSNGLSEKIF